MAANPQIGPGDNGIHGFRDRAEGTVSNSAPPPMAQALHTAPVPPQNLDAEESVLGAMMLSPRGLGAVSEVLDSGGRDFYRESHAKIYQAALALHAKGEALGADNSRGGLHAARRPRRG